MTKETSSSRDALVTGGLVAVALIIEHLALYRAPPNGEDELIGVAHYALGVATIGAGLTALELRRERPATALEFWTITLCAGCAIGGARLIRRWLRQQRRGYLENGELAATARGWRTWPDRTERPSGRLPI